MESTKFCSHLVLIFFLVQCSFGIGDLNLSLGLLLLFTMQRPAGKPMVQRSPRKRWEKIQLVHTAENTVDESFDNLMAMACGFTSLNVYAVDPKAYDVFRKSLPGCQTLKKWIHSDELVQSVCGVKYYNQMLNRDLLYWIDRGKLPLVHCLVYKLLRSHKTPIVIPLCINSVVHPCLRGQDDDSDNAMIDIHEVLSALKLIIGIEGQKRNFRLIVLGLKEKQSEEPTNRVRKTFERLIGEALFNQSLSNIWPDPKFEYCSEDDVSETLQNVLEWSDRNHASRENAANFKLEKKILEMTLKDADVLDDPFISQEEVAHLAEEVGLDGQEAANYLKLRTFLTVPDERYFKNNQDNCHQATGAQHEVFYLLHFRAIDQILLQLCKFSDLGKRVFDKSGLIPAKVVEDLLETFGGHLKWLPALRHCGVFIPSPDKLHCSHYEPREEFMEDQPKKSFIVPHLLHLRGSPRDSDDFAKNYPFVLRHKAVHGVSECLFYWLVAVLIKHFAEDPRCYHRAARLKVNAHQFLELKLDDNYKAIFATILTRKTDDAVASDKQDDDIAKRIKTTLETDAEEISVNYLNRKAGSIQSGTFIKSHDETDDFVDLTNKDVEQLTSEKGSHVFAPKQVYSWFGVDPPMPLAERFYPQLAEGLLEHDGTRKALKHLISKGLVGMGEYKAVVSSQDNSCNPQRFLNMLLKKQGSDQLLLVALRETGQTNLLPGFCAKPSGH